MPTRIEYHRAWREQNREKLRKYHRAWRAKNAIAVNTRFSKWVAENGEKVKKYKRDYFEKHRYKHYAGVKGYISRKKSATPKWADLWLVAGFYKTAARLTSETGVKHQVDHIVPIRSKLVCGLHCENNLRVIPASDNNKKNNRIWPNHPNDQ